jgi:hypothetical protein
MVASLKEEPAAVEACIASPEARYRGLENQLYRVEIHNGGVMSSGKSTEGNPEEPDRSPAEPDKAGAGGPTFKWSRENGSVVFPVESGLDTDGDFLTATLRHLGRDPRSGLVEGDWVEWVDEDIVLTHAARPLLRVVRVEPSTRRVTLTRPKGGDIARTDEKKRPFLRRWDQKSKRGQALREGAVPIAEGQLIPLEDGIMVQFKSNGARYRTGDYWLIPARTATGGIEWPRNRELPPSGVEHGYAPLAAIFFDPQKSKVIDFRMHFKAAGIPVAP